VLEKIVSGGQTGVDRAALDVAIALGLETGGWVPRGRRAEDGRIPVRYEGLRQTRSFGYEARTRLNVRDSDATLCLCFARRDRGTALTARVARKLRRPLLVLELESVGEAAAIVQLRRWLRAVRPSVLNVAGPRASTEPRVIGPASRILDAAIRAEGP
jgi:hypothetical protein